jgi:hypothetical protein
MNVRDCKREYRCNGLQSGEVALDAWYGRLELRHHDLSPSAVSIFQKKRTDRIIIYPYRVTTIS